MKNNGVKSDMMLRLRSCKMGNKMTSAPINNLKHPIKKKKNFHDDTMINSDHEHIFQQLYIRSDPPVPILISILTLNMFI